MSWKLYAHETETFNSIQAAGSKWIHVSWDTWHPTSPVSMALALLYTPALQEGGQAVTWGPTHQKRIEESALVQQGLTCVDGMQARPQEQCCGDDACHSNLQHRQGASSVVQRTASRLAS